MGLVKIQARVPKNRKIIVNIPDNIPVDAMIELHVSFQDENRDPMQAGGENNTIDLEHRRESLLDEDHVILMPSLKERKIEGRITARSIAEPEPVVTLENIDSDE